VEVEVFVLCHTGTMVHMDLGCGHLMIRPMIVIRFMEGPCPAPCSELAVGDFREGEVVAESLVAGEGFVGGKRINCMGAIDEARGIGHF
jgi:hypothetical protein